MTDFNEALKEIASYAVGVSDPDDIDDEEMLRWGDIRRALEVREPKPFQRKCWQAGTIEGHLCGPHCANEATQDDIDEFVREYWAERSREFETPLVRSLRENDEAWKKALGHD